MSDSVPTAEECATYLRWLRGQDDRSYEYVVRLSQRLADLRDDDDCDSEQAYQRNRLAITRAVMSVFPANKDATP